MILPPLAHDVKVISIGMFVPGNQPVVWRGPMLHRALQQFLADVFWGDLDVLLLDLPPGTGDIAISVAQLIPGAEILVVTTPQQAAAEVAERAGSIALQTHQRIVGVVENMSWLELPDGSRQEIFGTGGGQSGRRLAHPRSRARRCRCSARSRSTPGCARAATTACRSCWATRTARPRWRCAAIARGLSTRSQAWPAARWGSPPPVAEHRATGRAGDVVPGPSRVHAGVAPAWSGGVGVERRGPGRVVGSWRPTAP